MKIQWTRLMLEDFINEGLLNDEEQKILRTRIKGDTQIKQGMDLGISDRTVRRYVHKMQEKYDLLAKQDPVRFPQRVI